MNNYHPNVNLTIDINPKRFFDIQVITKNGKIKSAVYRKSTKLPVPWSSNIPITKTYILQNEFLQTLIRKITELKRSFSQQIIHKNLLKVSSVVLKMIK